MRELKTDDVIAIRELRNNYTLKAYAVNGEDRAVFRVHHKNDANLARHISAEDVVAIGAMEAKS